MPPALNNGNQIPNELPEVRRQSQQPQPRPPQHVRFNPEAQTVEYETDRAIAPPRTTRQHSARTGVPVPVPDHPLPRSALEHSEQMLNKYKTNIDKKFNKHFNLIVRLKMDNDLRLNIVKTMVKLYCTSSKII